MTGTYRLQLHDGFGFADAQAQLPYLASLGVSHLYLSPVLQAVPGSMHGYDVLDHTRVSQDLGGEEGLRALAAAARELDLGLVVDVVPNHMALRGARVGQRPAVGGAAGGPRRPHRALVRHRLEVRRGPARSARSSAARSPRRWRRATWCWTSSTASR